MNAEECNKNMYKIIDRKQIVKLNGKYCRNLIETRKKTMQMNLGRLCANSEEVKCQPFAINKEYYREKMSTHRIIKKFEQIQAHAKSKRPS